MNENVDLQQVEAPSPVKPAAPAAPRRRFARLVWVVVLVVAALLAWHYWPSGAPAPNAQSQNASGGPPQTVRDAPATTGDMPITIDALGAVTPLATITVKTQIAGRLMEVGFQEGQMVKQGDFLAQIDSRPYEAALALAQAQLAKDSALLDQAAGRSRALPDARKAGFDRAPAGRGSDNSRSRKTRRRSPPTRRRSTPPSSTSPIATSSRRSAAASACGSSIPATTCSRPIRPASSSSPKSIRSASSSPPPRTTCRRSRRG